MFYKFGTCARKVKCLTLGDLHCVYGQTDYLAINSDRSAEVSREYSTGDYSIFFSSRACLREGSNNCEAMYLGRIFGSAPE